MGGRLKWTFLIVTSTVGVAWGASRGVVAAKTLKVSRPLASNLVQPGMTSLSSTRQESRTSLPQAPKKPSLCLTEKIVLHSPRGFPLEAPENRSTLGVPSSSGISKSFPWFSSAAAPSSTLSGMGTQPIDSWRVSTPSFPLT